jgi:cytochrome c-type biogenesis protein CcmF
VCATFITAVVARHAWTQATRAAAGRGSSVRSELGRLLSSDPGYWGGQLSHIGVAVLALGLSFAGNLSAHTEVDLDPGEKASFAGYEITYDSPFIRDEPNRRVQGATVILSRGGETVATLQPRLNLFDNSAQAIPTPAVYTTVGGDVYLTLRLIDAGHVVLTLDSSPLMLTVWVGGLITAAGGFVAYRGRLRAPVDHRKTAGWRETADV